MTVRTAEPSDEIPDGQNNFDVARNYYRFGPDPHRPLFRLKTKTKETRPMDTRTDTQETTQESPNGAYRDESIPGFSGGMVLKQETQSFDDDSYRRDGLIGLMEGLVAFQQDSGNSVKMPTRKTFTRLGFCHKAIWYNRTWDAVFDEEALLIEARRLASEVVTRAEALPPGAATFEVNVQYVCSSLQQAIDHGINGFAGELLAESLGDKDKLVDGGLMFTYPFDHKNRPVWIIVTGQQPVVTDFHKSVAEQVAAASPSHETPV